MRSVSIGTAIGKNLRVYDDARSTHMHVLGISGQGKSYFLEQIVRQDILNGHGVCVIDPHGELYDSLSRWIVERNIDQYRKVHLLDPSNEKWTFGWNPLCLDNGRSISARVNAMTDAFVKVWGGGDMSATPRLYKILNAVFYALAHNKLSLAEARYLSRLHFKDIAKKLTETLDNVEYEDLWHEFLHEYPDKTFVESFESTISRLTVFLGDPVIRQIVGQTTNLIDFRRCMDERHIVLINMAKGKHLTDESSQLLGALFTTDLYNSAFGRDVDFAKQTPFYAVIDECADYLTDAIAKSLDQTRKFGLHLTLSHQRLWQLKKYGDDLYNSVMANAQLKVVFRVNDDDTASTMARHLFRQQFNLETPKHVLDKPVVVGHDILWLHSETSSVSDIHGQGESYSSSIGTADGLSQAFDAYDAEVAGHIKVSTETNGEAHGVSSFSAKGEAKAYGRSESLASRYEIMPTATYSLDELEHLGMVELLTLPKRHAFVFAQDIAAQRFSTKNLRAATILDRSVCRAIDTIGKKSDFSLTHTKAQQAIESRHAELLKLGGDDTAFAEKDYNPNDFME